MAINAFSHSKLLRCTDNCGMNTISNKDTRLTCTNKNCTKLTFVYVDASCSIKEANSALLTVRDLELLHMQLSGFSGEGLEPSIFEEEVFPFEFFLGEHNYITNDQYNKWRFFDASRTASMDRHA